MSNRMHSKMARYRNYRGWVLVEVGRNFYQACRGSRRLSVGAVRHGDFREMEERFRTIVDQEVDA